MYFGVLIELNFNLVVSRGKRKIDSLGVVQFFVFV